MMSRQTFGSRHIHASPLDLVVRSPSVVSLQRRFVGLGERIIHDPATVLRRIPLLRTRVNKGKKKGRGCCTPRPVAAVRGYWPPPL
jgi:hypothetical protein